MSERELSIWTIYDHPRDFPHNYVARRFIVGRVAGSPVATEELMIGPDLQALRAQLRERGLMCVPAMPGDDPKIVECWM